MPYLAAARRLASVLFAAVLAGVAAPAHAGLTLSKVIVDLPASALPREDIELWNSGAERIYVTAEPAMIVDAGQPTEKREVSGDPGATGLLVTPQKLVLEPDERKLLRIASILPADDRERIYRLTVKPVAGSVSAEKTSLKVFVGYDMLIIVRPTTVKGDISGVRRGRDLIIHNGSNSSAELAEGKQCDAAGANCVTLPATRLYAGADWTVALPYDTPASFRLIRGTAQIDRIFP